MRIVIGICSSTFKEVNITRIYKAALVKEQCRLEMGKYSFSQKAINEWNK